MRFVPNKTKYKKSQKGPIKNKVSSPFLLNKLVFGNIGLKTVSFGRITSKQLEAFRSTVQKVIKKVGRLTINIMADTQITSKPLEVRMGKGKGFVDHWACKIKSGSVFCSIQISSLSLGIIALKAGQIRLPIKTKIVIN